LTAAVTSGLLPTTRPAGPNLSAGHVLIVGNAVFEPPCSAISRPFEPHGGRLADHLLPSQRLDDGAQRHVLVRGPMPQPPDHIRVEPDTQLPFYATVTILAQPSDNRTHTHAQRTLVRTRFETGA
jgi:hypothetical protein